MYDSGNLFLDKKAMEKKPHYVFERKNQCLKYLSPQRNSQKSSLPDRKLVSASSAPQLGPFNVDQPISLFTHFKPPTVIINELQI